MHLFAMPDLFTRPAQCPDAEEFENLLVIRDKGAFIFWAAGLGF